MIHDYQSVNFFILCDSAKTLLVADTYWNQRRLAPYPDSVNKFMRNALLIIK